MLAEEMGSGVFWLQSVVCCVLLTEMLALQALSFSKSQRIASAFLHGGARQSRELRQFATSFKERDVFRWMRLPWEALSVTIPVWSTSKETRDKQCPVQDHACIFCHWLHISYWYGFMTAAHLGSSTKWQPWFCPPTSYTSFVFVVWSNNACLAMVV